MTRHLEDSRRFDALAHNAAIKEYVLITGWQATSKVVTDFVAPLNSVEC